MSSTSNNHRFGGQHVVNNVSSDSNSYDSSEVASTSQGEGDCAHLTKAQVFTEKEYKQILDMLNKEEPRRVNMAGITTCLMSKVVSQDWIIDQEQLII